MQFYRKSEARQTDKQNVLIRAKFSMALKFRALVDFEDHKKHSKKEVIPHLSPSGKKLRYNH